MAGSIKKLLRQKLINAIQESNHSLLDQQQRTLDAVQVLEVKQSELVEAISHVNTQLDTAQAKADGLEAMIRADYDNLHQTTLAVEAMRKQAAYQQALAEELPLISIRIATYNRSQTLIDKAVASILKQTYQNYEVVIVGDHCTDDTAEKIAALQDTRFSFYNLPSRSVYPEDRLKKWLVIGAPAMNAAAGLASGVWIAPLDDDDEFTTDHLEKLLQLAKNTNSEFVYGAMNQHNLATNEDTRIWSTPPEYGRISLNGAMYLSLLDNIFKYDFRSYVLDAAADWTMVRRMMESGVKISGLDEVVGTLNMIPVEDSRKDY